VVILTHSSSSVLNSVNTHESLVVLRHRKFHQYFTESSAKITALKIEYFQTFATQFLQF